MWTPQDAHVSPFSISGYRAMSTPRTLLYCQIDEYNQISDHLRASVTTKTAVANASLSFIQNKAVAQAYDYFGGACYCEIAENHSAM